VLSPQVPFINAIFLNKLIPPHTLTFNAGGMGGHLIQFLNLFQNAPNTGVSEVAPVIVNHEDQTPPASIVL
jgi:hypothetical protein